MALTELGLSRDSDPSLSRRAAEFPGLITATEAAILTGQIPSSWKPGIIGACTNRLAGVLAGARIDPRLRPLIPWIARQIVETGEAVVLLDNSLQLRPVSGYELRGTGENLSYESLTITGPSRSVEYRNVSRAQVVHAVIRPIPTMPWARRALATNGLQRHSTLGNGSGDSTRRRGSPWHDSAHRGHRVSRPPYWAFEEFF